MKTLRITLGGAGRSEGGPAPASHQRGARVRTTATSIKINRETQAQRDSCATACACCSAGTCRRHGSPAPRTAAKSPRGVHAQAGPQRHNWAGVRAQPNRLRLSDVTPATESPQRVSTRLRWPHPPKGSIRMSKALRRLHARPANKRATPRFPSPSVDSEAP